MNPSPNQYNPSAPTPTRNKFYSRKEDALEQTPLRRQPDFPTHHLLGNLDSLRTPRRAPQSFFPRVFESTEVKSSQAK